MYTRLDAESMEICDIESRGPHFRVFPDDESV